MTLLLQIVQTAADTSAVITTAPLETYVPEKLTLLGLLVKGGPVMIPIGICSLVAVYIIVERFIVINRAGREQPNFMNNIRDFITHGNIDAAKSLCRNNNSPIARMTEKGISRLGKPLADIEKAIENTGNVEVAKLERGLSALATCAGAAPMLGFLGTVTGMLRAFYDMKVYYEKTLESVNIGVLSSGMFEAMITTVAGLIVGILALVCYNILSSMVKKQINKMEANSLEFMDLLEEPVK